MTDGRYRDRGWLEERYEEGLTDHDVADMCGVRMSTISWWRSTFGIQAPNGSSRPDWARYRDPEWLQGKVDEGLDDEEIAKLCGVSRGTIRKWRKRAGIGPAPSQESWRDRRPHFLLESMDPEDIGLSPTGDRAR